MSKITCEKMKIKEYEKKRNVMSLRVWINKLANVQKTNQNLKQENWISLQRWKSQFPQVKIPQWPCVNFVWKFLQQRAYIFWAGVYYRITRDSPETTILKMADGDSEIVFHAPNHKSRVTDHDVGATTNLMQDELGEGEFDIVNSRFFGWHPFNKNWCQP